MLSNYSSSATTISNKLDNNTETKSKVAEPFNCSAVLLSSEIFFTLMKCHTKKKKGRIDFFTTLPPPQICNYPFYICQGD